PSFPLPHREHRGERGPATHRPALDRCGRPSRHVFDEPDHFLVQQWVYTLFDFDIFIDYRPVLSHHEAYQYPAFNTFLFRSLWIPEFFTHEGQKLFFTTGKLRIIIHRQHRRRRHHERIVDFQLTIQTAESKDEKPGQQGWFHGI